MDEKTMSYTPEDQKLDKPIYEALESLSTVAEVMQARIEDDGTGDGWTDSHKNELIEFVRDISYLRMRLLKLKAGTS